ncbi:ATP-binding protein [Labilibaculum euxinus]
MKVKDIINYTCYVETEQCILCEICEEICPNNSVFVERIHQGLVGDLVIDVTIDPIFCDACGDCIRICPTNAIKMRRREEWE